MIDIDTGIMLYSSKTNMSGNNSDYINCTDSELKDIFAGNIVIMDHLDFGNKYTYLSIELIN